jgi:hypothetical protein
MIDPRDDCLRDDDGMHAPSNRPAASMTRPARREDAERLEAIGWRSPVEAADHPAFVLEIDGVVVGIAAVLHHGPPTEPDTPVIRTALAASSSAIDRLALFEAAIDHAESLGLDRVLASCDPMKHDEVSMLESLGFRPAGRGPYVEAWSSPGLVHYVTGYQDASGSALDFVIDLPAVGGPSRAYPSA